MSMFEPKTQNIYFLLKKILFMEDSILHCLLSDGWCLIDGPEAQSVCVREEGSLPKINTTHSGYQGIQIIE